MDMNKFAKQNDLARKFEAAIGLLDVGNGWGVFKGLNKGRTQVIVTYDGQVRFHPAKKPRRRVKKKPDRSTQSAVEEKWKTEEKPIEAPEMEGGE